MLAFDDPRSANMIMQGPLLAVKGGNDVTDVQYQLAKHLGQHASEGAAIADWAAVREHDLELANHFARGRAELTQEKDRIYQGEQGQHAIDREIRGSQRLWVSELRDLLERQPCTGRCKFQRQ